MKNYLIISILFLTFFLLSAVFGQVQAAFLDFDRATVSVNPDSTFDVQITVDPGSEQISSVDAYIIFDSSLLEAQGVVPGDYFPTVINNVEAGKVYIAGLVDDPATYKTGSGSVSTITFKALAEGTATLTYDCQEGVYNSSKIIKNDVNATNIIQCTQNGRMTVTIGSGNGNVASPSALPKSGVFENVSRIAIPGMLLLMLGGALRIIL